MGKNLSDEEWDKLLEEQYLKEADFIEEALFSGDDWDDDEEETEEEVHAAYEDLVARLRASGDYREDEVLEAEVETETEVEAEVKGKAEMDAGREVKPDGKVDIEAEVIDEDSVEPEMLAEKVIPMPERKRRGKGSFKVARVAGFAFVGVLCVFAASLTSEANKKYFINNIRYLTGVDTRMTLNNDNSNEIANADEYKAIKEVEEKLGIEIPDFLYRPNRFAFYDCEINEVAEIVFLKYECEDTMISLYCMKKDKVGSSTNFSLHGEKIGTTELHWGKIPVDIFEVKAAEDNLSSYLAQWERNDVSYQLSGKMKKEEFIKFVEKIRFSS